MAMSPHQLTMLILEKPLVLAQLAAGKGIEPPETPEEAQEKLKDPSLSPQDRERLLGIAAGVVPQEGQGEFKPIGEAVGEAGGALVDALGGNPQMGVQSGLDEQSKLRKRDGNALTNALDGTQASQPSSESKKGFDPSAPGAPNIPAAQGPTGNAGAAAGAIAGSALAPLTQQLQAQPPAGAASTQQPTVNINVAPQGPQAFQPPTNFQTPASLTPTPVAQAAGAPAAPQMDPWAAALAGVGQASTPGGGVGSQRTPAAPQVNYGQALQPQTLAIIQALAQAQQRTPNLQALLSGGQ